MKNLFDPYDRKARLFPAFLILLPLALGVASWYSIEYKAISSIMAILVSLGLSSLLMNMSRDAGKKIENKLFEIWGGKPSVILLSYNSDTNKISLARYHDHLKKIDPRLWFPSNAEEEKRNYDVAMSNYASANDLIISKTRDNKRFNLLFEENINYGYRRNTYGLKPIGIATSLVGAVLCGSAFWAKGIVIDQYLILQGIYSIICILFLLFWLIKINDKWVRVTAMAYARQLIMACDQIQ